MLILASTTNDDLNNLSVIQVESVCLVTYQVIKYEIILTTEHSNFPIACPSKMLYKNIPEKITIKLENASPITGL